MGCLCGWARHDYGGYNDSGLELVMEILALLILVSPFVAVVWWLVGEFEKQVGKK
jgi:hypothetical protein